MTNSPYQLFILRCKKSRFTYSAHTQQLTALFLVIFELLCLTSYPRFWTNSRKMYYLCRRKAASQQNIQASLIFCIRFAFSLHHLPKKVLREPRRRLLLRPRAVTIDDRRRSSIKTQEGHYRVADKVLNCHLHIISANLLLLPEHSKKKRKKCKRKQWLMLQCVGGHGKLSEV